MRRVFGIALPWILTVSLIAVLVFVVPWDGCQRGTLWQRWMAVGAEPAPVLGATLLPAPAAAPTAAEPVILVDERSEALQELYRRANASVVSVKGLSAVGGERSELLQGLWGQPAQREFFVLREGSGFVYDELGHIVTNHHVVEGVDELQATLFDGTTYRATLVGSDVPTDLAVLRVDCPVERLHALPLGDSEAVQVGQQVVAIGNPYGLQGSMSAGIVSAVGRFLPSSTEETGATTYAVPGVIQTDAAINPGNSGGPLLNLAGQLVGVNTAIQSPVEGSAGVGFAVPARIVARVVPELLESGEYVHPWLGISTVTLNSLFNRHLGLPEDLRGALVDVVVEGGPAAQAGLRACSKRITVAGQELPCGGDILMYVDDQRIFTHSDLLGYLALRTEVGQTVQLGVFRDGEVIEVPIIVKGQPDLVTPEVDNIPVE